MEVKLSGVLFLFCFVFFVFCFFFFFSLRDGDKQQRERQTNTEKSEESERYRERDRSRKRSYHASTHAREKEIRTRELPVLPSRDPVPRMRINVPNKTGLTLLVSYFFRAHSPASRFTSPVFLDVRMRTGKASREKRQFSLIVSHSSRSLTSLSLSLTAQRRPTVLVSQ